MTIQMNIQTASQLFRKFWKLALAIWILKFMLIALAVAILSHNADAAELEAFGWKVSWGNEEIIDEVGEMQQEQAVITDKFDEEISFVNSFKESQIFLKELDYRRMGLIDTSTGEAFTIVVTEEGLISHVEKGLNDEEAVINADISRIRMAAENNDFVSIRKSVQIPFKVKMRILMSRWF